MPASTSKEALAFLMQQHGLKQNDLASLAPQSTISAVLSGKRAISKQLPTKLAARFGVSAVFV